MLSAGRRRVRGSLPEKALGRWSIVLHYRDFEKKHQSAEWEYNEEDPSKLYPFREWRTPQPFGPTNSQDRRSEISDEIRETV